MMVIVTLVAGLGFLLSAGLHIASYSGYVPPADVVNALFFILFPCAGLLAIVKGTNRFGLCFLSVLADWKKPQNFFFLILLTYTIGFYLISGHAGRISLEESVTPELFPETSLFFAFIYYYTALTSAEDC